MNNTICRCGVNKNSTMHPCHGKAYTCKKPAKQRFYNATPAYLSGMQMKFQVDETWACDECWENFKQMIKPND